MFKYIFWTECGMIRGTKTIMQTFINTLLYYVKYWIQQKQETLVVSVGAFEVGGVCVALQKNLFFWILCTLDTPKYT